MGCINCEFTEYPRGEKGRERRKIRGHIEFADNQWIDFIPLSGDNVINDKINISEILKVSRDISRDNYKVYLIVKREDKEYMVKYFFTTEREKYTLLDFLLKNQERILRKSGNLKLGRIGETRHAAQMSLFRTPNFREIDDEFPIEILDTIKSRKFQYNGQLHWNSREVFFKTTDGRNGWFTYYTDIIDVYQLSTHISDIIFIQDDKETKTTYYCVLSLSDGATIDELRSILKQKGDPRFTTYSPGRKVEEEVIFKRPLKYNVNVGKSDENESENRYQSRSKYETIDEFESNPEKYHKQVFETRRVIYKDEPVRRFPSANKPVTKTSDQIWLTVERPNI